MFTHVDQNNMPTMVDVSEKTSSIRMAEAMTSVRLPEVFRPYFEGEDLVLKKGPVFQTAIIAGTMATKKTHELIPFCHQIPVESCKINITRSDLLITITCKVKTSFKTGVEMEALHGASVAALTIYDMCKAISHEITLGETKLLAKTGGKNSILEKPVYGLILTGGKSSRMGEPKALINYRGVPHAQYLFDLLSKSCEKVFLSSKPSQWDGTSLNSYPTITDSYDGPIGGMLSAFEKFPDVNWIVLACDLVNINEKTIQKLLANAGPEIATCFKNQQKGFPEPLCAFYSPNARRIFMDAFRSGVTCPVKVLRNINVTLIDQGEGIDLMNINTPEERHEVR